ncbi:MAG TPA: FtsX-like permease family protein, partial [Cyclobacteriaceae bacterium]
QVTGKKLFVKSLLNENVLYFITCLILTTSLLAGFYPSIYLSTTRTIEALKGIKKGMTNSINWRMGLIVLQFSISAIMIVLSVVAYKQIRLINNKHLGFDKENSMTLANPYMLGSTDKILGLKNELLTIPGVENVSITGYTPSQNRWGNLKITFPDRDEKSLYAQTANWLTVDESFIKTMGMNLVAGRNFFEDHDHDKEVVIINEKAVSQFKLGTNGKSPIGGELSFNDVRENRYKHYTVVGVVADFNFGSLHDPIKPIVMKLGYHRFEMAVRLSSTYQKAETIGQIESMWKKHLPAIPFEYYFIKDRYDNLHKSDVAASNVFSFFCLETVILSALGLFSMVTYTIVNRTKEIGIRKLLGASERSIVLLLANQFAKLVVASYILGLPIAWMLSNKWLADFAYKIEISWWVYFSTGLVLILVTVLTVGYQTIKASLANPVDNLRYE